MKHALIDMHRLKHNPYNGLYTFCFELGKSLAAINDPQLHLHYYLPKKNFGWFGNDVSYRSHHSLHKFYMPRTSQYDIWHITTSLSWYHPFNKETKVVFTLHDLNFLIEEKENTVRNKRLLKEMQKRIDRADHIVGISNFALEFASEFIDFKGTPTSVIYNGFRVKEFPGYNTPIYTPQKKFLFALGLVQPRKKFHVLPALLTNNNYELTIAGLNHFEYADKIRDQARLHNVEDRVKLIGPISEEDKYWYYKNCEAFFFPSVAEGFGAPAIEAMHFGKPVFLSTKTCMPEIGGDAAYYFKSFEPVDMRQVFESSMHHYYETNAAEQIKQRAAFFSYDKAAAEYLSLYKNVLGI